MKQKHELTEILKIHEAEALISNYKHFLFLALKLQTLELQIKLSNHTTANINPKNPKQHHSEQQSN